MIVQNRKTLREYEITKEEYRKLVARQIHVNFKVIDDSDVKMGGKIPIPKEIIEYKKSPKSLKIEPKQTVKPKQPE